MEQYKILYHEDVVGVDIPKLSSDWKIRIKKAVEKKLCAHPEIFGVPLRQSLKGYWKLRAEDYRVIFRVEGTTVKILMIEQRSRVYRKSAEHIL